MAERGERQPDERNGEDVRRARLLADGGRAPAINLQETIVLTRKLFELRDAAQHARERAVL